MFARQFVAATFLAMVPALIPTAQAQYPWPQPPISGGDLLFGSVNQWFYAGQRLDVRRVAHLESQYGNRVNYVEITGSGRGAGNLQLLVNGVPTGGPQFAYGSSQTIRFPLFYGNNVLGQGIRTLQVVFRGQFYVSQVAVSIGGDFNPYPGPYNPYDPPYYPDDPYPNDPF